MVAPVTPYVAPACVIAQCLEDFAAYEFELEGVDMRDWTDTEVRVLCDIADRLGTTVPALVGVMANEAGCNPAAHNPGGAVGLIQFEPDTLRALGWTQGTDAFAKLDVVTQLGYVERYYSDPSRRPYVGLSDVAPYVLAFLPALGRHAAEDDYALCALGGPLAWAYRANSSFDVEHKGSITVADLRTAAQRAIARSAVAQSIIARAEDASQAVAVADTEPAPAGG